MPKKTLNEATVRQFMKLVNHKPTTISSFLKENYPVNEEEVNEEQVNEEEVNEGMYEEEGAPDEEAALDAAPDAELDAELPPAPDDAGPAPDAEGGVGDLGPGGELDITPEMAQALIEFGQMLSGAMGDELAGEEPVGDELGEPVGEPVEEPLDEPVDEPVEPAPEEEEMLEGEKPSLSEEEVVQEVARRVARRILQAKKASGNK